MTDRQTPIRNRRRLNDTREQPARRLSGMGYADLPPISAADAAAEPPAARTFPEVPGAGCRVPESPAPTPDTRSPTPDTHFTRGPARRPTPLVADPLLQWATGLPTTDRRMYAGWLVEAGKHAELDAAMGRAGVAPISIRHGSGNVVTHWALETAEVFVVTEGVQSIGEMKATWDRYGIAFAWRAAGAGYQGSGAGSRRPVPPTPDTRYLAPARMQSHLRCRVFLRELMAVGYIEPLLLTLKGTLTGDLITALMRQYEVLDAVDAFRAEAHKPPLSPPFYACSIPLGPGAEVTRGNGSVSKEIAPIVAQIPAPITKGYVLAHWIRPAWVPLIEGLIDATRAWSEATSRLTAAGEEEGGNG